MTTTPQELPPLPEAECCEWLKDGRRVNAFSFPPGPEMGEAYWVEKGYAAGPLFTAEQMHAYARAAIAEAEARAHTSRQSEVQAHERRLEAEAQLRRARELLAPYAWRDDVDVFLAGEEAKE